MLLAELSLGFVQPGWTFIFQILNTIILILVIYLIYKMIKKVFIKKTKLESRISSLENDLKNLKEKSDTRLNK